MIGDLKKNRVTLSHLQFVKLHKWCVENETMLRERTYDAVAKAATSVLGFPVSHTSVGECARDIGIVKHPTPPANNGQSFQGGKRAQVVYNAIEELYEQLGIQSSTRNALRTAFGYKPL